MIRRITQPTKKLLSKSISMKKLFLGFIALSLGFTSCNKRVEIDVSIYSPQEGKTYTSPIPLKVKFDSYMALLHDVEIEIYQKSNPDIKIYDFDMHIDEEGYLVEDTIYANVSTPTVFVMEIDAGEKVEVHKRVEFTIAP